MSLIMVTEFNWEIIGYGIRKELSRLGNLYYLRQSLRTQNHSNVLQHSSVKQLYQIYKKTSNRSVQVSLNRPPSHAMKLFHLIAFLRPPTTADTRPSHLTSSITPTLLILFINSKTQRITI